MRTRKYLQLAGRVIIRGFESTGFDDDLKAALQDGASGGLIFFRRNVESHLQVAALIEEARSLVPPEFPVSFSVDQEGGRVVRFGDPLTVLPSARKLASVQDPSFTEDCGYLVGRELRSLGMTVDFAPVLDVDTHPDSPVIGDRAYGKDPKDVVTHGLAFARGLRRGGVVPCAKHFPGHGDASLDSHLHLPRVNHVRERLDEVELAPFGAWCQAGLGPIMTAHVVYPSLDGGNPATTSSPIIERLLRQELGFQGTVLSDDLEMGAVGEFGGARAVALKSIRAGVDGLLICRSFEIQEGVREIIAKEAMEDAAFRRRLETAATNVGKLDPSHIPSPDPGFIGSATHEKIKDPLRRRLDRLTD